MIHTIMFFLLNWSYFIAALWVIAAIAVFEFLPPLLPRKQIALTCLIIAGAQAEAAYLFHKGMAYQQEIFDKASAKEAARQRDQLEAAQKDGQDAVLALQFEKTERQKVQADYDKLSDAFNAKQCLTPEQLRRITETGKSGAH